MALLPRGWKAAIAVVLVAVLSLFVLMGDLNNPERRGLFKIYLIGAAVGLTVSIVAVILMKSGTSHIRAKNLILTVGALFGGAAVLAVESVSGAIIGEAASDTGFLLLNYALGYFMVGVTMDALRVRKALKRQNAKK